jgi:hypothetical protein
MKELRKCRLGLVGVMCTPFRGDKEGQFAESGRGLSALTDTLGFDLHIVSQGIYDLDHANQARAELLDWGPDFLLLQTSSFAPGELIYPLSDLNCELGLWAVPEGVPTAEGGLPLNSFTAANMYNSILGSFLRNYRRPVKWFYGPPGQDLFDERLEITVRALSARVHLQNARVGLVGGVAPGFDNLIIDEATLYERLGVRVLHIELDEVLQRARSYEEKEISSTRDAIRSSATRLAEDQSASLEKTSRVFRSLADLSQEAGLDAYAISCWPKFQEEYHLAVCGVVGQLNESQLVASCEGDVTSAVSMLALQGMSGGDRVTLMDLAAFDESDESILLWHCGPTPPSLAEEGRVEMQSLWLFDGYEGEPIGLQHNLVLKAGRVTVGGFSTDFQRMLVLDGSIDPSKPSYIGSRGWLRDLRLNTQPLSVRDLVQTVMGSHFQHHYPLVYGDYSDVLMELATWLEVGPIKLQRYTPYHVE